jgi:hypothetical protein
VLRAAFVILLAAAPSSFASKSAGEVALAKPLGPNLFAVALASPIENRPACNTSNRYVLDTRFPDVSATVTVLTNLRNHTLWKLQEKPVVTMIGTGSCVREPDAEDAQGLIIMGGETTMYSNLYLTNFGPVKYGPREGPPPPVIGNVARQKPPVMRAMLEQYLEDLCKMSPFDVAKKWGVPENQFPDKSAIDALLKEYLSDKLARPAMKVFCWGEGAFHRTGITAYAEAVQGDNASALWLDEGEHFHCAGFVKLNGQWKVLYVGIP